MPWYNYLKDYIDEGNTHQLAGEFNTYAEFFSTVKADGKVGTADELHNVGEAIVGVNYGMENGIWWGFDSKARGQFCLDSNEGVRIGYGENRDAWTSGAVYRNEATGEVHGYLGSSERQAVASSFAFVSKTKDVFFDGYGPTRMYVYDVPGGTDYQKGQINAERFIDITWGEDVAPGVINGTYQIMNVQTVNNGRSGKSGNLLTWNGSSNVTSSKRVTSGTTQHWKVYPSYTDGDISYWFIDNVAPNSTKVNLNVLNNNLESGAGVICWDAKHNATEQWYLKYAGEGSYYIISRLSNKYLYCSSTTSGTRITLSDGPTESTPEATLKRYMWRFIPLEAGADMEAPDAPTALKAKQRMGSIELSWTPSTDEDVASYTILRGIVDESGIEWNTIGRNNTDTIFVDNTTVAGTEYVYKVFAVDLSGNRSEVSDTLRATPLAEKGLLCQLQFDGTLTDNSANHFNVSLYGKETYTTSANYVKSGTQSLNLNGSSYAMLPYSVGHQDEMTIATWVRPTASLSSNQHLFDFGNDTDQYMYFTPSNSSSKSCFVMKNGDKEQKLEASNISSRAIAHVAVTIKPIEDGKVQAIIYIDGKQSAETSEFTIKPSDIAPSLCYIGRAILSSHPMFNGYIDDFRVYNYALSAEEVAAIMEDTDEVSEDIDDVYTEVEQGNDDEGGDNGDDDNNGGDNGGDDGGDDDDDNGGEVAIDGVKQDAKATKLYDLNGRLTNNAAKGIVIQDGKKILKK